MAKTEKVDVYNQGSRSYHSPSGVELKPNSTTALDADEAASMMAGYSRDLISPDKLRSPASVQANKDQEELIASLKDQLAKVPKDMKEAQAKIAELTKALSEANSLLEAAGKQVAELQAKIAELTPKV